MAEAIDNKNLQQIDKSPISYYIITGDPDVVKITYADTGNIVIFTGHDGNEINKESKFTNYTDLYIGDEHIAGGFGFKNTTERNYAYDVLFNQFPDLVNIVSNITEGDSENTTSNSFTTITVDSQFKYIQTETTKYALDLNENTGVLSIISEERESINKFEVFLTKNLGSVETTEKLKSDDSLNLMMLGDKFKLSYLTFDYTGNEEPLGFYISMMTNNNQDIKTSTTVTEDICGSQSDYISVGETGKAIIPHNMYALVDPDFNPTQVQQKWKIEFTDSFISTLYNKCSNKSCIVDLKINVILNKRKLTASFVKIAFIPPIFYRSASDNSDWGENIVNSTEFNKTLSLCYDNDSIILSFNHTLSETYEYVLIPETILYHDVVIGSPRYPDSTMKIPKFILLKSGVEFEWIDTGSINIHLGDGGSTVYRKYCSPNKFSGSNLTTQWKIIF